jgi:hypothetical protein
MFIFVAWSFNTCIYFSGTVQNNIIVTNCLHYYVRWYYFQNLEQDGRTDANVLIIIIIIIITNITNNKNCHTRNITHHKESATS